MADISTNIRRLREDAGLSQERLAAKIGKTRSAISQYENGTSMPRMGVVEDLARALGVTKAELIEPHTVIYTAMTIPVDEDELLALFRGMPSEKREQLLRIARAL